MTPNSWQDLHNMFIDELNDWIKEFPSMPFIEKTIKQAFAYYDKSGTKPDSRDDWKRIINFFMRNNWDKESSKIQMANKLSQRSEAALNDDEIKQQIELIKVEVNCPKCLGLGTVGMYKNSNNCYYSFLCICRLGDLSSGLREHQSRSIKTAGGSYDIPRTKRYNELSKEEWTRDF